MSKAVKLPKKQIEDLLTGLQAGTNTAVNGNDKNKVIAALELVIEKGLVTSGKGGGRGGVAQTSAMKDYVTAFEAFNTKNCPKGHFIDMNGNKRTPKLYMPQPKKK
tara:strand:- start:202 stop:519 length:318 start_codon:yes stop_codon:yes gene_type:complete